MNIAKKRKTNICAPKRENVYTGIDYTELLPDELWHSIIWHASLVNHTTLYYMRSVSKKFYYISMDPTLCAKITEKHLSCTSSFPMYIRLSGPNDTNKEIWDRKRKIETSWSYDSPQVTDYLLHHAEMGKTLYIKKGSCPPGTRVLETRFTKIISFLLYILQKGKITQEEYCNLPSFFFTNNHLGKMINGEIIYSTDTRLFFSLVIKEILKYCKSYMKNDFLLYMLTLANEKSITLCSSTKSQYSNSFSTCPDVIAASWSLGIFFRPIWNVNFLLFSDFLKMFKTDEFYETCCPLMHIIDTLYHKGKNWTLVRKRGEDVLVNGLKSFFSKDVSVDSITIQHDWFPYFYTTAFALGLSSICSLLQTLFSARPRNLYSLHTNYSNTNKTPEYPYHYLYIWEHVDEFIVTSFFLDHAIECFKRLPCEEREKIVNEIASCLKNKPVYIVEDNGIVTAGAISIYYNFPIKQFTLLDQMLGFNDTAMALLLLKAVKHDKTHLRMDAFCTLFSKEYNGRKIDFTLAKDWKNDIFNFVNVSSRVEMLRAISLFTTTFSIGIAFLGEMVMNMITRNNSKNTLIIVPKMLLSSLLSIGCLDIREFLKVFKMIKRKTWYYSVLEDVVKEKEWSWTMFLSFPEFAAWTFATNEPITVENAPVYIALKCNALTLTKLQKQRLVEKIYYAYLSTTYLMIDDYQPGMANVASKALSHIDGNKMIQQWRQYIYIITGKSIKIESLLCFLCSL